MIFDHDIKFNGEWYKAGMEVPMSADASAKPEPEEIKEVAEVIDATEEESKPKRAYKKRKVEE